MNTAYLVTGTTRGIGRALADVILEGDNRLFSLSSAPDRTAGQWVNLQCDLGNPDQVVACGRRLLDKMCACGPGAMVLINNAAVLDPVGPVERIDIQSLLRHLHINQAAPLLLMSTFITCSGTFDGKRQIINISSGAARSPYSGWAMYCSTKAALDMMSLCAALDQQGRGRPVSVSVVYPGRVDTAMQSAIRRTDPSKFPRHADFVRAKQNGTLTSPSDVSRMIIDLYRQGQLDNGGIYDLRSARVSNGRYTIDPLRTASTQSP